VRLFLFPKIKSALKGTRFESVDAVKAKATQLLNSLTQDDLHAVAQLVEAQRYKPESHGFYS